MKLKVDIDIQLFHLEGMIPRQNFPKYTPAVMTSQVSTRGEVSYTLQEQTVDLLCYFASPDDCMSIQSCLTVYRFYTRCLAAAALCCFIPLAVFSLHSVDHAQQVQALHPNLESQSVTMPGDVQTAQQHTTFAA